MLFPVLKSPGTWTPKEVRSRVWALQIARELGLRVLDLQRPLEELVATGVVLSEAPGDTFHPGPAAARHFARALVSMGIVAL